MMTGECFTFREIDMARFRGPIGLVLVAISRPEAPLYAFVAGLTGGLGLLFSPNGFRRVLYWAPRWLAVCAAPFLLWHGWRWSYFAWEFPNTYYAKLDGENRFRPWSWSIKRGGWDYLRAYALASGTGFWLGLYMLGQTGWKGFRKWLFIPLFILHILLLIPGLSWLRTIILSEPTWFAELRIASLFATFLVLPLIGLGRHGWRARLLAYNLTGVVLFFALYSGWDWMQGYRWLSFCAIPMAVLMTDALGLVSDRVQETQWRDSLRVWLIIRMPIAIVFVISTVTTVVYVNRLETSPFDVYRRVLYMQQVQQRLHLDHVTLLEVDMGAHMWWSGFHLVDMAGLIDVPMGHHKWDKPFISEYVYEERNPEFAHVHGSWASKTKMKSHKEWKRYLKIHPYPINPSYHHDGNHIRKDLLIKDQWPGPLGRAVSFARGVELVGWDTPSAIGIPGETLYLESGWRKTRNTPDFRVVAFLSNGTLSVIRELPPAYDWLPPHRWKKNTDIVMAYHSFTLPSDLPTGNYDLGFFV